MSFIVNIRLFRMEHCTIGVNCYNGDLNGKFSLKKDLHLKTKTPRPGLEPGSKDPQSFRMSTTLPGQVSCLL